MIKYKKGTSKVLKKVCDKCRNDFTHENISDPSYDFTIKLTQTINNLDSGLNEITNAEIHLCKRCSLVLFKILKQSRYRFNYSKIIV